MLELKPFDVVDSNKVGLQSSFTIDYDSLTKTPIIELNLVEFLSSRSSLNFKNYGPGLLATPTFRGGDANHTQLLWNGLKINSPMLGTIDFSTIPMSQFSGISIITGNSMNLYASGGLGGGVLLDQSVNYKDNFVQLGHTISSFNNYSQSVRVNQNFKLAQMPASISVNADYQSLSNRFPYIDISDEPYESKVMSNAGLKRRNISPMLSFMPHKSMNISLIYWYNEAERSIPSPINTATSIAQQHDKVHRSMAVFDYTPSKKFTLSYRAMFEDNVNAYTDSSLSIANSNDYQSIQNQIDVGVQFIKNLKLSAQLNHTHIEAISKNYRERAISDAFNAMFNIEYRWLKDRLLLELGTRYSTFNVNSALLPFGGLSFKPFNAFPITLSVSASQNARFPTLNEVFWQPGGSDSIKTEKSDLVEFGVQYQTPTFTFKAAVFNGVYTDRIRWLPNGGVFSPTNIDYSEVRGIDLFVEKGLALQNHSFKFRANVQLIDAQGGTSSENMNALSFIPSFSGNFNLQYELKKFRMNYTYVYLGKRFITNNETSYLPSYHLSNVSASYEVDLTKGVNLGMTIGVDNVFDWQYQNMPWRPMPGRMYVLQFNMIWIR